VDDESDYRIVAARIQQRDELLWQVPGLSLTAQAFLFIISLGNSSNLSRLIASSLSTIISILSMHLMIRHRTLIHRDVTLIEEYEKQRPKSTKHRSPYAPLPHSSRHPFLRWFESSTNVWLVGLALFGLAAALVFILTLCNPSLLGPDAH
jgi:hypothetical protein